MILDFEIDVIFFITLFLELEKLSNKITVSFFFILNKILKKTGF